MRNFKTWLVILASIGTAPAFAGMTGMNISATTLALTSSTKQGGQGPGGSTLLTHFDMVYNWSWYGIGLSYSLDLQGSAEKDHVLSPKIEFHMDEFYLESGFSVMVQRSFTDRSIASQTGNGWYVGLGVRFGLESPDTGWFFQASYKLRTLNISKQDGVALSEAITIVDGFPLVGLGLNF